jgi:hypothetical protein
VNGPVNSRDWRADTGLLADAAGRGKHKGTVLEHMVGTSRVG